MASDGLFSQYAAMGVESSTTKSGEKMYVDGDDWQRYKLRFILPCKSACQPICQNSIQIFQIKFLVFYPKFSRTYSPSVFFKDELKLYVFESLK